MSKREDASATLLSAMRCYDYDHARLWTREAVDILIDAAKEELRAEMATNVLGPSEQGVADGGVTE